MKKCVLVVVALLLATMCSAQKFFEFGPKAALNFSQFSTNINELESNMKSGFDAGLFFRFGKSFYVQPELLFSFKSLDLVESYDQIKDSINAKSTSLELPILLGYKLFNTREFNLRVFAGPRISFAIKDDFKSTYKSAKFNYAGQFGVGVDIVIFSIDFRYDYTFSEFAKDESNDAKLNMNSFIISLGIKF